jgi:HK97 family phage portal protein
LVDALGGGVSAAGKTVTENNATSVPAVYSCVRILAEALAITPMPLFRKDGEQNPVEMRNHPLWRVMNTRANEDMTAYTWHELSQTHRGLWGNSYSVIVRNGKNDVVELLPLLPDVTFPQRVDGQLWYLSTVDGRGIKIPARDILHIKGLGGDGLVGWSPIRIQKEQIGSMMAQQEFSARLWKNGATLNGVLSFPGTVVDKEAFRKDWEAYVGSDNAMKTAILEEGMKYERIGIPPEEAQFVETQKISSLQVAMAFGVPPHRLNIMDRVTFNNIEHMGMEFVQYTLMPWYNRIEQECAFKLLRDSERSLYFKFNANGLMRGDFKARTEAYSKAVGGPGTQGWMAVNEVRRLEELPTMEGWDEIVTAGSGEPEPEPEDDVDDVPVEEEEDEDVDRRLRMILDKLVGREARRIVKMHAKHSDISGLAAHLANVFTVPESVTRTFLGTLQMEIRKADEVTEALVADLIQRHVVVYL